ncbi:hypothetical protein pb186bvf_020051 [Paramecium bursaria]
MADQVSKEAFEYLNKIRQNPKIGIPALQEQVKAFRGKFLKVDGKDIKTAEGVAAWNEAIAYLEAQKPLPPLKLNDGLNAAAKFHVDDIGPKGQRGHSSSDGTDGESRLNKFGDFTTNMGENICYNAKTGQAIILQLIVDDGVGGRPHRVNCFDPRFKEVGVAFGPHKQQDFISVFDFADEFIPLGQKKPEPQPQPQQTPSRKADKKPSQAETTPQKAEPAKVQPNRFTPKQEIEKPAFDLDKYVRPTRPIEEVREIKQAFDIFDQDGSGSIDPKELKEAFEALGYKGQSKFIYQVMAELDEDNSGGIDFDEFLKLATAKANDKPSEDQVRKIFNFYDTTKEGRIQWEELKRVAQDLGEDMTDEEIFAMFQKADLDEDGFVTFTDFYNLMTGRQYWDN